MNVLTPHDPGGKVKTPLSEGVVGHAEFYGPNDCYRPWLSRTWGLPGEAEQGFILFIGMNPSTADANANDPTIRRELFFANREDFQVLVKCNVMDYRATSPAKLREPGIVPCSAMNLPTIERYAAGASKIICCWGALHRSLRHHADVVETMLRAQGRDLWCLGLTAGLSPRHPLYVRGDAPLVEFKEILV